jgi:hypothetical protein
MVNRRSSRKSGRRSMRVGLSGRRSGRRSMRVNTIGRRLSDVIQQVRRSSKRSSRRGSKKSSPYNIFMSKELKKLKKEHPDWDHKDRFKEAASRWKGQ